MNMHVATPTERLLYAAHQERLKKFWPVKEPEGVVKETCAPVQELPTRVVPNVYDVWFKLAWEYLEPANCQRENPATISFIKAEVCDYFGIEHSQLIGPRRLAQFVRARQIGYFLCSKTTQHSLPVIGRHFGGRDHTTILYGVRSVERKLPSDPELASDIAAIERRLA